MTEQSQGFTTVVAIQGGYEIQCTECDNYVSGFHPIELSAQHAADLHRDWHHSKDDEELPSEHVCERCGIALSKHGDDHPFEMWR